MLGVEKKDTLDKSALIRAGDAVRTRDSLLGKQELYH